MGLPMAHLIPVAKELDTAFLQGRPLGRAHFPVLCGLLTEVKAGETVLLDFGDAEMVTGSWINEALVPLFEWASQQRNDIFPVIVNFNEDWLDELSLVGELTHKCFLVSRGKRLPKTASLIGKLDVGQRETLHAASTVKEATGAKLERSGINKAVRATAWNNRLRDLYQKRLLKREKRGREQVYSPVVQEVSVDG
jgi:hypothetical protein